MVYLPTCTIKKNVGKYTIHGWYGLDYIATLFTTNRQRPEKMGRLPPDVTMAILKNPAQS